MPSFKVGDRVEAPGGKVGTVKWTGKNPKFAKGTWVGVEYDSAVGDCDGKAKDGKYYFRCKGKKGTYQKPSYFKAASSGGGGKKKKKGADSSSSAGGKKKKGKKKPKTPQPDEDEEMDFGGGGDVPDLLALVTGTGGGGGGDDDSSGGKKKKGKGGAAKAAVAAPTETRAIQTDPPEEAFSNQELARYILVYERDKNAALLAENEDLKNKLRAAQQELTEERGKGASEGHTSSMVQLENQELKMKIAELEISKEMLQIELENAQLDCEDYKERIEENIQSTLTAAIGDVSDQEKAELLVVNENLKESLDKMQRSMEMIVSEKNSEIELLSLQNAMIPLLEARIRDLIPMERQVEDLQWEMEQNSSAAEELKQTERILDEIKEKYVVIEGEIQDWRSYILMVDDERRLLNELNDENDVIIEDLQQMTKELKQKLMNSNQEVKRKEADLRELQKEFFKVKQELDEINRAQTEASFDSTSIVSTTGTIDDDGGIDGERNEDAAAQKAKQLANMNFLLSKQIAEARGELARRIGSAVKSRELEVRVDLLRGYFPTTLTLDEPGMSMICDVERVLGKCVEIRKLFEEFYVNPKRSASKNADLCLNSHLICSLLISLENYMRCIQHWLLRLTQEDWPVFAKKFKSVFNGAHSADKNVEFGIDQLIEAFQESKLAEFDLEMLMKAEKLVKQLVNDAISDDSLKPDSVASMRADARAKKSQVLKSISETNYRMQSITIHMNKFSSQINQIMNTAIQATEKVSAEAVTSALERAQEASLTDGMAEDEKVSESDVSAPTIGTGSSLPLGATVSHGHSATVDDSKAQKDAAVARLRIGLIEKMFRLRNSICETCEYILEKTNPINVGFKPKKRVSTQQLDSANRTSVTIGQLNECLSTTRQGLTRVQSVVDQIEKVDAKMLLPMERTDAINRILDKESEVFEEGLVSSLDKAFVAVRSVMKLMDSVSFSTVTTTDELGSLTKEDLEHLDKEILKKAGFEMDAMPILLSLTNPSMIADGGSESISASKKKDLERTKKLIDEKRSQVWEVKSSKIRLEIDAAYDLRLKMDEKNQEIDETKRRMREMQDLIDQKRTAMDVLAKQVERDEKQFEETVEMQQKFEKMSKMHESYVQESASQTRKIRDLENQLQTAMNNIEQYKKAVSFMKTETAKKPATKSPLSSRLGRGGRGAQAKRAVVAATSAPEAPSSANGSGNGGPNITIGVTADQIRKGDVPKEVLMAIAASAVTPDNPAVDMAGDDNPFVLMYMSLLQKTISALHKRLNQYQFMYANSMTPLTLDSFAEDYARQLLAIQKKRDRMIKRNRVRGMTKGLGSVDVSGAADGEATAATSEASLVDENKEDTKEDSPEQLMEAELTMEDILAGRTKPSEGDELDPMSSSSDIGVKSKTPDPIDVESPSAQELKRLSSSISSLKAIPKVADITSHEKAASSAHTLVSRQLRLRNTQQRLCELQQKMDEIQSQRAALLGTRRQSSSKQASKTGSRLARVVVPPAKDGAAGLPAKEVSVLISSDDLPKLSDMIGV